MKRKVKLLDKQIIKEYLSIISIISVGLSMILAFIEIPKESKECIGGGFLILLGIIYLILWVRANRMRNVILNINASEVQVKVGDIFEESIENALKVIGCNEYFDTQVDNKIITETSIHGQFIIKHLDKIGSIADLNSKMEEDDILEEKIEEINNDRKIPKRKKYKLGTVYEYEGYLLTAFTKFDNNNRAYLRMKEYIGFLINFWDEIDICINGRTIIIPLMGSGITRFKDYSLSEQELLELLIWSFRVSRIKFPYPSKVIILIHESKQDKINFYKLKEY